MNEYHIVYQDPSGKILEEYSTESVPPNAGDFVLLPEKSKPDEYQAYLVTERLYAPLGEGTVRIFMTCQIKG